MKRTLLLLALIAFGLFVHAQSYDAAKNLLAIGQVKKAKEELDKGMTNSKYTSKPEAYMLKMAIYANLAQDNEYKGTPAGEALLAEAESAFIKYKEMQPEMTLMKEPIYQNGPIHLYTALFSKGYKDYEKKNWQPSYETFKKVVDLSDLMIREKLLSVPVDTNSLILAGITAESSKNNEDAAKYYSRLADIKVNDKDYESIYRFLVNYNFRKKDMAGFDKYRALGKEIYPKSEFFNFDKVDFAVGLEEKFSDKIKAVEDVLAADPNNYKANFLLGGLIYDTLNSNEEGAKLPANYDELEAKMIAALRKANEVDPKVETPLIYMGGHFVNKAKRVNDQRKAHAADMKARTKPGTQSSKEDIQKREALDQLYTRSLEATIEPYEKAAAIYAAKPTLTQREKQQYRYLAGDLGEIYSYKKGQAKSKPAEAAKFAAAEKKWNELYDSIK